MLITQHLLRMALADEIHRRHKSGTGWRISRHHKSSRWFHPASSLLDFGTLGSYSWHLCQFWYNCAITLFWPALESTSPQCSWPKKTKRGLRSTSHWQWDLFLYIWKLHSLFQDYLMILFEAFGMVLGFLPKEINVLRAEPKFHEENGMWRSKQRKN